MIPYGIQSDTHNHGWSAFSTILPSGINSRLQSILDETWRLALEIKAKGGKSLYHTGDLFHVRGNIAPSVLNPTLDLYRRIVEELGIQPRLLAGNHDLEGRDAKRVSSAITALEGVGCEIVNELTCFADDRVVMIPWTQDITALKAEINRAVDEINGHAHSHMHNDWTLMIHAPVDGVITGLPAHGLTDVDLKGYGFKYVFSGHYHHHKSFGNGVYSVGASTHQTWSDVNSKAGFLIVSDEGVKWYKSHAPEFVEINGDTDEVELKATVNGAYVRAKIVSAKQSDVERVREYLLRECNAAGVTILTTKSTVEAARTSSTVKAGASIEESVTEFIKKSSSTDPERLGLLCSAILTEARMEIAE